MTAGAFVNRRPAAEMADLDQTKVTQTLRLAWGHLPGGDPVVLDGLDGVEVHQLGDWGALVYVPEDPERWLGQHEVPDDADLAALALHVLAVQLYARRHGCSWVMFDVDGPRADLAWWAV